MSNSTTGVSTFTAAPDRNLDPARWAEATSLRAVAADEETVSEQFLDSFDARLYAAGVTLSVVRRNRRRLLECRRLDGSAVSQGPVRKSPVWASELPPTAVLARRALGIRALVTQCEWSGTEREWRLVDGLDKTVVRVSVRAGRASAGGVAADAPRIVSVWPLKGFEADARRIARVLTGPALDLAPCASVYAVLMASVERDPRGVMPCVPAALAPDLPAAAAVALLLDAMRRTVEQNLPGTAADLDSEFLHDLRVAVRRSRSLLGRLKTVWSGPESARLSAELKWLGEATGSKRDLDVYLLGEDDYRAVLPHGDAVALDPLYRHIRRLQRRAHRTLVAQLDSERFRALMRQWADDVRTVPGGADAERPIIDVANATIRRQWRRVRRHGRRIDAATPAEALHDLRIECKKLRYLLEAFASLYEPGAMVELVRGLKRLQDNLGNFQDFEIQSGELRAFALAMNRRRALPVPTLLAMGRLVEHLSTLQARERQRFVKRWAGFDTKANTRFANASFAVNEKRGSGGSVWMS